MAMRVGAARTRKEKAADAAIEVIAENGLRGLTHRAVDVRAGLPDGSTSSCFRTRLALQCGVLDRMVEQQEEMLARWPAVSWRADTPAEREAAVEAVTDLLEWLLGEARAQTQVRLEMYLDAVRRSELHPYMEKASRRYLDFAVESLRAGGVPDAEHRGRLILAQLDGILFDALSRPFWGEADRDWLRLAADACLTGIGV